MTRPTRGHKKEAEGYIIPYNASWKSEKKPKWNTLKSMNEFVKQVNDNIQANQILFLLDCCFSGIASKAQEYDIAPDHKPIGMRNAAKKNLSVQIITASNKDESVIDSGKDPLHSIFTQTILDFIQNEKAFDYPEGFISASILKKKIAPMVVSESFVWGNGRRQEPQFYRTDFDNLGEFVVKQFSDEEINEQKKKEDKIIITESDELMKSADLLSFLNSNCIVNQINQEIVKQPEKKFTASSFLVLIKKKIKSDLTINNKIKHLTETKKLTPKQVEKLWNGLAFNILILGVKIPIISPLIPDYSIMTNNKKEEIKEE